MKPNRLRKHMKLTLDDRTRDLLEQLKGLDGESASKIIDRLVLEYAIKSGLEEGK